LILPHVGKESIIILDDIYWSAGMTRAWKEIIREPRISLSIDLYRMGILFFTPDLSKQNFRIWF